jgi:hypothetical protein
MLSIIIIIIIEAQLWRELIENPETWKKRGTSLSLLYW